MIGFYKTDGLCLFRDIIGIAIIDRHKERQMETEREMKKRKE